MSKTNQSTNMHFKIVHRTINGCPVSIWADTQKRSESDLMVLRQLLAAYEDRLKNEHVDK